MKIELSKEDLKAVAEMVSADVKKALVFNASLTNEYEAMVARGRDAALKFYGEREVKTGIVDVVREEAQKITKQELSALLKYEISQLMGDDEKLQQMLFRHLLEGVVEKARAITNHIEFGDSEDD